MDQGWIKLDCPLPFFFFENVFEKQIIQEITCILLVQPITGMAVIKILS